MLWMLFWVVVSMFAVLVLLETIVVLIELMALRKVRSVRNATFRVELSGHEPNMEYLINTLCLMAERMDLGPVEVSLEIIDQGLDENARRALLEYCQKNPWVRFTEVQDDDLI
jgi:hypothetical protein